MSIQSEISRIRSNVSAAYDAVSELGGVVPEGENANSENLAEAIRTGAQALLSTKQDTLTGQSGQVVGFNANGAAVAVQGWSGPSLVINGDFRRPVNRNGRSLYTAAGQTIDLWSLSMSAPGISVQVMPEGISLNKEQAGVFGRIAQRLESPGLLSGKTVTVSVLAKGDTTPYLLLFLNGEASGIGMINIPLTDEYKLYSFTRTLRSGEITRVDAAIGFQTSTPAGNCALLGFKIDWGGKQTLAHQDADGNWVLNDPPDYDLQYALCSLYSPITGKWVGNQHSNPNLLDNWYFADPVNQRGQTEYTTTGYTIDRWSVHDGGNLVLDDGYITFYGRSREGYDNFRQSIEPSAYRGLKLTFSVLYRSSNTDWVVVAKGVGSSDVLAKLENTQGKFELATIRVAVSSTTALGFFAIMRITKDAQTGIDLIAAKLELGTQQTLARQDADGNWALNDPPPNKALELYRCSAFQFKNTGGSTEFVRAAQIETNGIFFDIPVLAPMRANPQIINPDALSVTTVSGSMQTGFTFSAVALGSTLRIFASKANHGLTDASLSASGVLFDSNL